MHIPRKLETWLVIVAVAGATGCHPDPIDVAPCPASLLPGDLVITEIMANPAGGPAGGRIRSPGGVSGEPPGEWIEIFNPTGVPFDLAEVILRAGPAEGAGAREHILADLAIEPGAYLVVGAGPAPAAPPVDHAYGDDLGDLDDDAGRIALACDVIEIDAVVYGAMSDGVARGLAGSVPPDYVINDDAASWCDASTEYAAGSFGTPGGPGDCEAGMASGTCEDDGARRATRPPAPGAVVITEIMANPDAVSDSDGEWVEIRALAGFDLNGVALGRELGGEPEQIIDANECLPVAAGAHAVLAKSDDPATNGGLSRVDALLELSLGNSRGALFLAIGGAVLDEVSWSGAAAGISSGVDPDFADATANDRAEYWCDDDSTLYGAGDSGTPGQRNRECVIVIPGMCDDGGTLRPVVSPGPGDIVLSEYLANPDGVSDTTGEWIEVVVRGDDDLDLNGLQLGREPGTILATIEAPECLRVSPGTHAVFARSDDPASNGGLPRVDATLGFGLLNTSSGLFVGVAGEVLDSLTYAGSVAGAATGRDPDDSLTWCPGTEPYGDGSNLGTPGASNSSCDPGVTRWNPR